MRHLKSKTTLTAYSSDASIYAKVPMGVIQACSESDAINAVLEARNRNSSITPRGGGTGLAGGAVGSGLVLDMGQYRKIYKIDSGQQTVHAQVGIIYDELNLALKEFGLFFPPDPSSGDSCQIGGMIANNSSGPRSVKYGLTSHFVEELGIISAGGKKINLKRLKVSSNELDNFFKDHPEYEKVFMLIRNNSELIKDRWPKLRKNSAGYNLNQVIRELDNGIFNLPALIVGSEGTLALHLDVRLRLLPIPKEKLTIRTYFKSLVSAGRAVEDILKLDPSGLEIVDGSTLDLIGRGKYNIPADTSALLLVEFDEDISGKRLTFESVAKNFDLAAPVDYATDPIQAAPLWRARRAIVPILYRHHPTKRPIPMIEDIIVPPDKIPRFIEYTSDLFGSYGLTYGLFGHIGDGNLHIRPLLDINNRCELELAREIYEKVYNEVISIGGSTTGEHGDGRIRSGLLKRLYGEEIFNIFRQIKDTLDPQNIFSPDSSLALIDFTKDIDYEKLKSYCAACGKCNGYCPAHDIFRREDYSPRGWLRILNQSGASAKDIDNHLSFCLNCKSCATVCPAGVDIADEIMQFRSQKPSIISKTAARFADNETILNLSLKIGAAVGPLFGQYNRFPEPAQKSLRQRFKERISKTGDVAFFHGCADNLFKSNVGDAVFRVFDYLGINISLPEQKCCGLPYEVYGLKDNLIKKARYNIERLADFDTVITGCASCLYRLLEYKCLFEDDSEYGSMARELAAKCFDISQYLNKIDIDYSSFESDTITRVTYHNPCHLRAAERQDEPNKLLSRIKGIEIIDPVHADCCCGLAGSYGYTHPDESRQIFEKKKKNYDNIDAEYLITSCPSCQMKIRAEMEDKFDVVHPIEILAARLDGG